MVPCGRSRRRALPLGVVRPGGGRGAGLRRGELIALRWRDVAFVRRAITVRRAVSGDVEVESTKSRRAREVPLTDQVASALDRLRRRTHWSLVAGVALGSTGHIAAATVSSIAAQHIAGSTAWSGVPGAAVVLGAAGLRLA